ncbi:MAG TPA: hypothetical protein VFA00_10400 [Actinomycetota bacterium]|nr:hypothetical protein [Actinomycetota bacterium]
MLFGLGLPEWITIFALIGALLLTFKLMARASIAYEKARQAREQPREQQGATDRKEDSE